MIAAWPRFAPVFRLGAGFLVAVAVTGISWGCAASGDWSIRFVSHGGPGYNIELFVRKDGVVGVPGRGSSGVGFICEDVNLSKAERNKFAFLISEIPETLPYGFRLDGVQAKDGLVYGISVITSDGFRSFAFDGLEDASATRPPWMVDIPPWMSNIYVELANVAQRAEACLDRARESRKTQKRGSQ
jgi:hypothetical protein